MSLQTIMQFKFFTTTAILEPGYLKLHIYCYRCYCSECSPMAIGQGSLCFLDINNEQVILAQTCKLKLKVI